MVCFHLSASYPILKGYKLCFWRLSAGLGWVLPLQWYWEDGIFICGCSWFSLPKQICPLLYDEKQRTIFLLRGISDCPEAKDQVRLYISASSCVILYHCDGNIYIGFECKVARCFSSSKSFYVLSLILEEPSPLPAYSVGLVSQTSLLQSWLILPQGANSSSSSKLLWNRWFKS